ncbi:MAG: EamA family transporter [Firmicutes bacterium]|nr:EamA family transporter [Bacillota bacterium]
MDIGKKCLFYTHFAVAMFSAASLFGKFINQPAFVIVAGRLLFSSMTILIYLKIRNISVKMNDKKAYFSMVLLGVTLAVHWIAFYSSVQASTVAITLLTFSTCPIFTTFLEPLFFKSKIHNKDIMTAAVAFLGVVFVAPVNNFSNSMLIGFVEGIFSGLTFSFLSIIEKKYAAIYNGTVISFYEQTVAFIVILPFVLFAGIENMSATDASLLFVFGTVFTFLSRSLFITGLKGISAQTAGIINSIEPIYGIILAAVLLNEIPSPREVLGGIIILSAVVYSSMTALKKSETKF